MVWLSHKFQSWGNWTASCPILSCSAPASVTLQLLACLECEQFLVACSRESPARSSRESLFFLRTLEHFFTLSHSLPLQESHLIVEIQANLARNKANNRLQIYFTFKPFPKKKKKKTEPRERERVRENRPPLEKEMMVTWTWDRLHHRRGHASHRWSSKDRLHHRSALFLSSSLCHPCHRSTLFLSTHVERPTVT